MKRVIGRLNNKKIVIGNNVRNYADGNTELIKEGNAILEKKDGEWQELSNSEIEEETIEENTL